MYTMEVHKINLKQSRGDPLRDNEIALIDAAMTYYEQSTLGRTAQELEEIEAFDDKLAYATIACNAFYNAIGASENDVQRIREGNISDLERKMLHYLICLQVYADDRTHWCQVCDKVFFAARDNDHLCDDCLGKLLIWIDGRTECLE